MGYSRIEILTYLLKTAIILVLFLGGVGCIDKIRDTQSTKFFEGLSAIMEKEKLRLRLKAYDHRVLDKSVQLIIDAIKRTGSELIGPVPLPTKIRRYTVLRSPHINKDSREQFEIRVHTRMIDIIAASSDTVDALMKLDLAPEVDVEVRSMAA